MIPAEPFGVKFGVEDRVNRLIVSRTNQADPVRAFAGAVSVRIYETPIEALVANGPMATLNGKIGLTP